MKNDVVKINPIHEYKGAWYFWDETGTKRIGSYISEFAAQVGFEDYMRELEEKRTGKYNLDTEDKRELEIDERREGERRKITDRRERDRRKKVA